MKKKNKKSKIFVQSWGTYPFDILFCFGCTDEEVYAKLKRLGEDLDKEAKEVLKCPGNGRTCMLENGQTVIRLKGTKFTPSIVACLAHEIFHAIHFLFTRINIRLSHDSDEAFAYAMTFMMIKASMRLEK